MEYTIKHGTITAYRNHGCRCEECTNAQAANTWASGRINKWETPLRIEADDSLMPSRAIVPSLLIEQAILKEHHFKIAVLRKVWHELKREGKGNYGY